MILFLIVLGLVWVVCGSISAMAWNAVSSKEFGTPVSKGIIVLCVLYGTAGLIASLPDISVYGLKKWW